MNSASCGSPLTSRFNYENCTISIQTKFDKFMNREKDESKLVDRVIVVILIRLSYMTHQQELGQLLIT